MSMGKATFRGIHWGWSLSFVFLIFLERYPLVKVYIAIGNGFGSCGMFMDVHGWDVPWVVNFARLYSFLENDGRIHSVSAGFPRGFSWEATLKFPRKLLMGFGVQIL